MIGNRNLGFLVSVSDCAGVVSEAGFVLVKKQQTEKTGGVISKQFSSSQDAVILEKFADAAYRQDSEYTSDEKTKRDI